MTAIHEPASVPNPQATPPLCVVGIGAAGVSLLELLARSGCDGARFLAVDVDPATLATSSINTKLRLESPALRSAMTGGDPERGRAVAEENSAQLTEACRGTEVVLILAGLGGGTGTGVSPVLARVAREGGALVLACAVTPFDCLGSLRLNQSQTALEKLRAAADGVLCLPNQKIAGLIDERTGLADTFRAANDVLAQSLRGLLGLLTRRGVIPIHHEKLCAVLRGRHADGVLASAEASGPNRALDVVEKLLAHPLLDGGQALATAGSVVVSINGGADLSLADLNRVMEQLQRRCDHAEVLMGACVDEALRERLSVTVIATRRAERAVPAANGEAADAAASPDSTKPEGEATEFLSMGEPGRGRTRLVPPAPTLLPEEVEQKLARQGGAASRGRKAKNRFQQGTLPLEIVSRGRFEKTEPNIHRGEDLDTPTFMRRGVLLN